MNLFSAAAAMPTDLGPIEPLTLLDCLLDDIEGGSASSLSSWVMMGDVLPSGHGTL